MKIRHVKEEDLDIVNEMGGPPKKVEPKEFRDHVKCEKVGNYFKMKELDNYIMDMLGFIDPLSILY